MNIHYQPDNTRFFLEGEEAQHCLKVLRKQKGDILLITDGRGKKTTARLTETTKSVCRYESMGVELVEPPRCRIKMAVCPTRKAERNEWMVEKMTELGVQEINFVVSEHTQRLTLSRVVHMDRLHRIALSAMKQSQQFFLPKINFFSSITDFFEQNEAEERYIAYVAQGQGHEHLVQKVSGAESVAVLIGPEGDFSPAEIQQAFDSGFQPVSLGNTRLRTETAAVIACHSVQLARILRG
jgi:16S rRNA (uracil1498-N3)-methyltransferase